jgi:hypothetical protein
MTLIMPLLNTSYCPGAMEEPERHSKHGVHYCADFCCAASSSSSSFRHRSLDVASDCYYYHKIHGLLIFHCHCLLHVLSCTPEDMTSHTYAHVNPVRLCELYTLRVTQVGTIWRETDQYGHIRQNRHIKHIRHVRHIRS